jgi:hypothetical protein
MVIIYHHILSINLSKTFVNIISINNFESNQIEQMLSISYLKIIMLKSMEYENYYSFIYIEHQCLIFIYPGHNIYVMTIKSPLYNVMGNGMK